MALHVYKAMHGDVLRAIYSILHNYEGNSHTFNRDSLHRGLVGILDSTREGHLSICSQHAWFAIALGSQRSACSGSRVSTAGAAP